MTHYRITHTVQQQTFYDDISVLSKSGGGISLTFTWNGTQKPYGSFFLGTSPELEMALYTVCFMSR